MWLGIALQEIVHSILAASSAFSYQPAKVMQLYGSLARPEQISSRRYHFVPGAESMFSHKQSQVMEP